MLVSLGILGLAGAVFAVRRPLLMSAPRCLAGRWHGCVDTVNGVLLMMLVGLPLAGTMRMRWLHKCLPDQPRVYQVIDSYVRERLATQTVHDRHRLQAMLGEAGC